MAYDFPSSPTNGQQYTPAGGQTYTYDSAGTKWTVTGTGLSGLPTASTTDVLTGTSTSVAVTPDALAALWEVHPTASAVTAASTISLGEGSVFYVSGSTGINDIDFAVDKAGRTAWLIFNGITTITSSVNLQIPGGVSITTAASDACLVLSEGSDIVRILHYQRAANGANIVTASTYTPTLSHVANVSASSASPIHYAQNGTNVHVWGSVQATVTTGGSSAGLTLTLPIASNLINTQDVGGAAAGIQVNVVGSINADITGDRAYLQWLTTLTVNTAYAFNFTYRIF